MQLFIMDLKESNPTQWLSLLSACTMSTGYVSSYLQKSLIITGPETQENGSKGNWTGYCYTYTATASLIA